MAILTNERLAQNPEIELLIPEVEQETRRRRRRAARRAAAIVAVAAMVAVALVLAGVAGAGGTRGALRGGSASVRPLAVAGTLRPVGFPPSKEATSFRNVSCASGTACIVVGDVLGRTTVTNAAWRYEGGTWQRISSPLWTNRDGPGPLSCPTATFCVMVSNHWASSRGAKEHASVQVLSHGRWREEGTPSPQHLTDDALQAVDCLSPSWCMALGTGTVPTGRETYADLYQQGRWSLLTVPPSIGDDEPGIAESVGGLSCTSSTFCLAVGEAPGSAGAIATADSWDGTSWTPVPVPRIPNSELGRPGEIISGKKITILPWDQALTGVSCATPTQCTASGEFFADDGPGGGLGGSFIMRFNGTSITRVLLMAKGPGVAAHPDGALDGIACVAAVRCASFTEGFDFALLLRGPHPVDAVQLDGRGWFTSSWTYRHWLPEPTDISCLRNGRCLIVGSLQFTGPTTPANPERPLVLEAIARRL